jgi:hypothetical protein
MNACFPLDSRSPATSLPSLVAIAADIRLNSCHVTSPISEVVIAYDSHEDVFLCDSAKAWQDPNLVVVGVYNKHHSEAQIINDCEHTRSTYQQICNVPLALGLGKFVATVFLKVSAVLLVAASAGVVYGLWSRFL